MQSLALLRRIAIALALVGAALTGYLVWARLTNTSPLLCTGSGSCDIVQQSRYAEVGNIPVAAIGLAGYLAILLCLIAEEIRIYPAAMPAVTFGLSLIGTIYSAYLTYLEIEVIHAICLYCVVSAILMTGIFFVALYRVVMLFRQTDLQS